MRFLLSLFCFVFLVFPSKNSSGRGNLFAKLTGDFFPFYYCTCIFLFLVVCLFKDKKRVRDTTRRIATNICKAKNVIFSVIFFFLTGTENPRRREENSLRAQDKINHATYHHNSGNFSFLFLFTVKMTFFSFRFSLAPLCRS